MKFHFYDIESLSNVFMLANFKPEENTLDVFYILDTPGIFAKNEDIHKNVTDYVHLRNKNFDGTVNVYDLKNFSNVELLAKEIGVSDAGLFDNPGYNVTNPKHTDSFKNKYRPVCTTDPDYNEEEHPFLLGYNSYNYDTTMLAFYFGRVLYIRNGQKFVTAKKMREYNDRLFSPSYRDNMSKALQFKWDGKKLRRSDAEVKRVYIRKNMLLTGRHIDVARLNEKQQHVGLKRLLGMLGYQILESDKLAANVDHIDTAEEFYELVAYNASDVINLRELFNHSLYQAQFSLKKQLLDTYPQIVYKEKVDASGNGTYEADVRPESVKANRLLIDSSSAQFATACLCPYKNLHDIETVSFMYPSERKAKELGVKRVNVLDECKKFFYNNFDQPVLRKKFDSIYEYYKKIEGKNFNNSKYYHEDYNHRLPVSKLSEMGEFNGCMPYFKADGKMSSCYTLFSTGGIHGAEYNMELYRSDYKDYQQNVKDLAYVQERYVSPKEVLSAKAIEFPDGRVRNARDFVSGTGKTMAFKMFEKPQLFKKKTNSLQWKLNDRYTYTSMAPTNHEDFTSYYPNMLRMLSAFWNENLGYDRYAEIFDNKQKYGKMMKDKKYTSEERNFYAVLREGTKLILNSASGAGDTAYDSAIIMNNRILSMRIIGQLFTWRIGQAQTLHGASIISTNTDGLYSELEEELNNEILAKESADIGVEIEPEPLYLISKDSNNRMELDKDFNIISASGSTLACHKGPNPAKALSHPAILDYALAEYLILCAKGVNGLSIEKEFDYSVGRKLLEGARAKFIEEYGEKKGNFHWMLMFQNILASSPGTFTYHFTTTDTDSTPKIIPHYNRVFFMKDGYKNGVHIHAAASRKTNKEPVHDEVAMEVLRQNGVLERDIAQRDVGVYKINDVAPERYMLILNKSLHEVTGDEIEDLVKNINIDEYLSLLGWRYENSWQNATPENPEEVVLPVFRQTSLF